MPAVSLFSGLVFNALADGKSFLDLQLCVFASLKCWGTTTGECSCLLSSNRTILGELLFTFQGAFLPEVVTFRAKVASWINLFSFFVSLPHPLNPCSKQSCLHRDPGSQAAWRKPRKDRVLSVVPNLMAVKWHFVVA